MRVYYKVDTATGPQIVDMQKLGKVGSPLAHEWPRISMSPDKRTVLLRVEWAVDAGGFDKTPGVTRLTEDEAIALKRSWQK